MAAIAGLAVVAGLGAVALLTSADDDGVDVVTETVADVDQSTRPDPAPAPSDLGSVRICPDPQPLWHETASLVTVDGSTLQTAPVGSDPVVFDDVPAGELWLEFRYESDPAPSSEGVEIGTASRLERQLITVTAGQTTEVRC